MGTRFSLRLRILEGEDFTQNSGAPRREIAD
jgi:hypothetical protein